MGVVNACTICGHPDGPSVIWVWYEHQRDRICAGCFAWACQIFKTVKVQKTYV